jgi:predicted transport protein
LPIELWEAKLFSNNTILFNQIQSPVYNEESHFEGSADYIKHLYSKVKEAILSIASDISVRPKVKYISYVRKRNFVDIVVRKSNLTLFLNIKVGLLNDPKGIARNVSKVGHWGNGDYEVVLKGNADIDYVNSLIRQSYENN